jgi:hypothetical protein
MVSIKCFNQILTPISVVLSGKFSQDSDQKELGVKYTKGFLAKKICKSLYILREKSQKLSYLDNEFMEVDRTNGDQKNKFTWLVTSSQIWLIPPVDDHQSTY